ncbi:MAG: hypothetical protein CMJ88_05675 [Planctomycetes bacterium]|nr:hypothetical protein [Planctomycetota bacterium]
MATLARSALLCTAGLLAAQDDTRDALILNDGSVLRGRVATPYDPEEILILNGGRRTRALREDVASTDTVAARIAAFFELRLRYRRSPRALRYLVDWAESRQLHDLARLQATELVLVDDDDSAMHDFLGHRRRRKQWLWQHDGKWRTREDIDDAMLKRPLRLQGERFALSCDAGALTNVRALFDLERLAVAWFERFGRELELREVLEPIEVRTYKDAETFPKWGFRPRPYFEPPPHNNVARTFYSGPAPQRPDLLFFVGVQGLLYRSMIGEANRQDNRSRVCAWLEIGLGMHMERMMRGDAGFAAPGSTAPEDLVALRALGRGYKLTHLVHLPMYASFYLTQATSTETNWAAAEMFVTWLLDGAAGHDLRDPFLRYLAAALRDRKGDSSSAFDRIVGTPIERLEEPWLDWLNELAGN